MFNNVLCVFSMHICPLTTKQNQKLQQAYAKCVFFQKKENPIKRFPLAKFKVTNLIVHSAIKKNDSLSSLEA